MPNYLCTTCGTQYAETEHPPAACLICQDERQYVGASGQHWTTLDDLRKSHRNMFKGEEPGLISLGMEPSFAIGQRALLVRSPEGNVLWDCVPRFDDAVVELVNGIGGISAIAISHPHYYTTMVEWSRAFGAPIFLHAADRQWVMRPDACIEFWEGETKAFGEGLTLVRCGGHFAGGTALHWRDGAEGRGVLLSGDILQVTADRRWVSFMYSYPNFIPLPAAAVRRIVEAIEPFHFERIYGAFWGAVVSQDGKAAVHRSARRYCDALSDTSIDDAAR